MNKKRPSAQSSDYGLVAWLENTRIALPLKGVECRFEVTGAIACVELDQIYHQNADRPLDCTYTFPLPAGAAVYRCELHVNGRVIRAKVEEKEKARKIYREQKAAGRRAALVETERENLFTLSLGNVQPDDVIVVRFAWFQVLDRAGEGLRLLVPTCPGVRYIPGKPLLRGLSGRGTVDDTDQVPDASRITPPRIDALHPDAAYFSIEGRLSCADVESGSVSSPSHPIFVRESGEAVTIELSGRGTVPDRDFVLAWREPKSKQLTPQAWRWTEGEDTYALVQLRAPEGVQVAEGFGQDFYFLVDRSGSMEGAKWEQTCQAVQAFVLLLGAEDRVWITVFESSYRDFDEVPRPAPQVLADEGFRQMEALGTGGGTELLPAVNHILEKIAGHSRERRAVVVLITDGQVGNEKEIRKAFRKMPSVTVHTFGIDTTVNDAFLKSLARQHRGGCWLQTPDDDITGTIAGLGFRLRRPVVTDLGVGRIWDAASCLPDLHAEEVVTIALRTGKSGLLKLRGKLPDQSNYTSTIALERHGSEALKLLWAKERIEALLESGRQPEAIALARQHNLICAGTAFIAWDEAEQVEIAKEELVQPALAPGQIKCRMADLSEEPARMYCLAPREFDVSRHYNIAEIASESGPDLQGLAARLRQTLEQAGVPEPAIEALVGWGQIHKRQAEERLRALQEAAELISHIRSSLETSALRDGFGYRLNEVLGRSPEDLISWAKETWAGLERLTRLQRRLWNTKTPEEIIERLMLWVWERGDTDRHRLEKLEGLLVSLRYLPFSAGSKARLWRRFLESTVGLNSEAYAVALRWLPEMANVTAKRSGDTMSCSTASVLAAQSSSPRPL